MTGATFPGQPDLLESGQRKRSQLIITRVQSVNVSNRGYFVALALIFAIGVFLRLPPALFDDHGPLHSIAAFHPNSKWHEMRLVGVDEELYRGYVEQLSEKGLTHYPDIILGYIEKQLKLPGSILPPVRFLYILAGYAWHSIFGTEALSSLKGIASLASILTLAMAAALALRMRGPVWSLAVMALVAFAPTQIHMSQHALVDGFFTFWALLTIWMLWENLQSPRHWGWLIGYTAALTFLVLTKENSFFVWIAIVLVLVANRWLRYGTVSAELLIATVLGPILGVVILIFLAGGADILLGTYRFSLPRTIIFPTPSRPATGHGTATWSISYSLVQLFSCSRSAHSFGSIARNAPSYFCSSLSAAVT